MQKKINDFVLNSENIKIKEDKFKGAFLFSAIGDALGWPQEFKRQSAEDIREFISWEKLIGGRWWGKAGGDLNGAQFHGLVHSDHGHDEEYDGRQGDQPVNVQQQGAVRFTRPAQPETGKKDKEQEQGCAASPYQGGIHFNSLKCTPRRSCTFRNHVPMLPMTFPDRVIPGPRTRII